MDLSAKVLADVRAERDELRGLVERAVAELAGVEAFSLERLIPHNSVTRLLHDLRAALRAPEGTPGEGKGP